ncbi:MAG: peptidylprolyl isomerase [Gammaproteobacteria bacterium]|nr:peptidylprolyl isomerase [Gammaproteobacteria bacterium]
MSTKQTISENKLVELSYEVIDEKTGDVLTSVEYPIGYVHGKNSVLSSRVTAELEGRTAGDIIEVPIDGDTLYGPRDESLVITDYIENVPEEYREVGTRIVMENDKGDTKGFIVTRIDEKTLTIDGNNPLCGRSLVFRLEVLKVRDATPEEIEVGGNVVAGPDVGQAMLSINKAKPTTTSD